MRVKNLPSSSSAGELLVPDSSSKAKRPIPNRKDYPGSRQQKARYPYVGEMCGLYELAPVDTRDMTVDVFGQLQREVEGVDRVELHLEGSKTRQKTEAIIISNTTSSCTRTVRRILAWSSDWHATRTGRTPTIRSPSLGCSSTRGTELRSWKRGESCAKRSKERSSCQCGSVTGTSTSDKNIETLRPTTSILRRQTNQSLSVREAHLRSRQAWC